MTLKIVTRIFILPVIILSSTVFANSQEITYNEARLTNHAYSCTFEASSLFGEFDSYDAQVIGDDFISHGNGSPGLVFARVANSAYMWVQNNNVVDTHATFHKFDYQKVKEAMNLSYDFRWNNFMIFVEPEAHSPCVALNQADIVIPKIPFIDQTREIIKILNTEKSTFKSLRFATYLPPYDPYELKNYYVDATNQGYSNPDEFLIGFELSNDYLKIEITEYKRQPGTNGCGEAKSVTTNCLTVGKSAKYEIFGGPQAVFYLTIGDTFIKLVLKNITNGQERYSNMSFSEVAQLIDTFTEIDESFIQDFHHM